jgi:cytochrome d ubiquinol oxidase subunit II
MPLEIPVAGVMVVGLTVYTLTGGADFGGGVWDLLASGPRKRQQRLLIAEALAPIWESNHVWLILVVVLMFVCFPPAFAAISIALHVPLTLMLIGVVLRGSAFVFRAYDPALKDRTTGGWQRTFAVASAATPVMLGVSLGAVASGSLTLDPETGRVVTDFFSQWLAPFPFAVGALTLSLSAMLAAVYLTLETDDPALQEDFRKRALAGVVAVASASWWALLAARSGAPGLFAALTSSPWAIGLQSGAALAGAATLGALWTRQYAMARLGAGAQVIFLIGGFAMAQWPYIIPPHLTFADAAAPEVILGPVLAALGAGSLVLLPAFLWLYRVFRGAKLSRDAATE